MINNYVCYHLHTYYSLCDSCTSPEEYIDYAAELGQKAICFTEHGNCYSWFKKKHYAESKGLKYLFGVECYLTERFKNPDNSKDKNIRDNYHTILIAKNKDGLTELFRLLFLSTNTTHKYYKPRLSFEEFLNISNNIIKISACVQGPLNKYRLKLKNDGATREQKKILFKLLKHYDYYEIQYHNCNIEYNQYLYKMSKKFNKPLIAATDTHSLNSYKAECRTMLQYGKTDGSWGDDENECDLTYKTYSELVEAFEKQNSLPMDVVLKAIENTNIMADSVEEIIFDTKDKYPILYGDRDEEMLWRTIKDNYKYKRNKGIISDDIQYVNNIKEEMAVFKKINMIGFMLFMSEIMSWAKNEGIATGFARGSVAGSTVAYITNITDVDPVKWNTVFSRFANEHRIEAGDIDTDWYEDDRQKIYDHIIDRFGSDKTAYILAVGTLADKSVVDTIGKAYRVMAEKRGDSTPYSLEKIKEIKSEMDVSFEDTAKKYPDLFYYYDGLANCVVSQSQHPAGIIVSPLNLVDNYGGFYGEDEQIILPIDMDECHDLGNIKYDILGLKSVGVIDKTYKMIGKRFPRADEVDWGDQKVFEDIAKDNTAIFQFESQYSGECLKRFKPTNINGLSLVNACIRPSGETYRDELLARHFHKNPSPMIDEMLKDNLGWLVYQEDTLAFLQQICGMPGSDADSIRRAIGHKNKDFIAKALPKILAGYCAKSDKPKEQAEKEAKEFLDVIESSASYQFGFNHSLSYSLLSYLMGYLRYYYPTEFCTSFLNCAKNDDDIQNGTRLALSKGCKIVNPKFGFASIEFSCDAKTKTIYKGLNSIKNISNSIDVKIKKLQAANCKTFLDVLIKAKEYKINKKQMDILIKISFFSDYGSISDLLHQKTIFEDVYGRQEFRFESWRYSVDILKKYSSKCTEKTAKELDTIGLIKALVVNTPTPKFTLRQQLQTEMDILGYIATTAPSFDEDVYYVVDTRGYNNKILELYQLNTGDTVVVKNRVKKMKPIEKGDIIRVNELYKDFKWKPLGKDENGKMQFERDYKNKEWVLTNFKFLNSKEEN